MRVSIGVNEGIMGVNEGIMGVNEGIMRVLMGCYCSSNHCSPLSATDCIMAESAGGQLSVTISFPQYQDHQESLCFYLL